MQITVNGRPHQTGAPTIAALLQEFEISQTGVAVALNGEVIAKSQLEHTSISDGAKIEIVRAVQGG